MSDHQTTIVPHAMDSCNTARHAADHDCGTRFEVNCSCGFGQGAGCREQADAIARGHRARPKAEVIAWRPGPPLTADAITDDDLRMLFVQHCECRPLDLLRSTDDHAAIHDCDTAILSDIQIALGIVLFNDIGRVQAIREARARCAEIINVTRRGE
jgi:hypothetical protein